MKYIQWKEILEAIDSENKDNVIEKIQEKLKIEDAEEYYKWEKANFDTNHLFAIEHISHTIECGQFGFSSVCEKKEIHHKTLFILAVINGCTRIAEALIEKVVADALTEKGVDVHTADKDGITPLHLAAKNGQIEMVKFLIKRGANVNAQSAVNKLTPLHCAAVRKNNKEIIEILIKKGANVNALDESKNTPLHSASAEGHNSCQEVIKTLIKNGANVNAKNKDGWTPLHVAASYFSSERIIETLIERGVNVNAVDEDKRTPLHVAASSFKEENIKALIKKGNAASFLQDKDDKTPLDYSNDAYDYIMQLLKEKAIKKGVIYGSSTAVLGAIIMAIAITNEIATVNATSIIAAVIIITIVAVAVGSAAYISSNPNTKVNGTKQSLELLSFNKL